MTINETTAGRLKEFNLTVSREAASVMLERIELLEEQVMGAQNAGVQINANSIATSVRFIAETMLESLVALELKIDNNFSLLHHGGFMHGGN